MRLNIESDGTPAETRILDAESARNLASIGSRTVGFRAGGDA
jgi:hypothetical protein